MSCTLEELQQTEYDILCSFADFCDKYGLEYILFGGTLLGAVRHNGFIPWDDDVDVGMNVRDFKKFVKLIKKHPIKGLHLSWIDSEPQSPYCFAKLRKCGTFVPAINNETLDMHNGVWIDIFAYSSYPKTALCRKAQEFAYRLFSILSSFYRNSETDINQFLGDYKKIAKILSKMSYKRINRLRKFFFNIYSSFGSKNSEYVVFNNWIQESTGAFPRRYYTPTCNHVFNDREFKIAINYDEDLSNNYGDYMTPVKFPSHANLSRIEVFSNRKQG